MVRLPVYGLSVSDQDGSSFARTPVSPGGSRRPIAVGIAVVALLIGSFVVARLSPEPPVGQASSSATPAVDEVPAQSVESTIPEIETTATALPRLEWFTADSAPIEDVLVEADQIRWLRLGSARIADQAVAQPSDDLVLQTEGWGTVCLCWQAPGTESGDPRALDLVRLRGDLSEISRKTVMVVNGLAMDGRANAPLQVALAPSPDGRFAYLVRAVRSATQWQVSLDRIDLVSGAVAGSVDLVALQQRDRSVVLTVEPPTVRVAPDGRHVLVMAGTQRLTSMGPVSSTRRAWIVSVGGSDLGAVTPVDEIADAAARISEGPCAWIAFVSPTIIARGCRYLDDSGASSFEIRRTDIAGVSLHPIVGDPSAPTSEQVLIDVSRGIAYAWDPAGLRLLAADLVHGGWVTAAPPSQDRDNPVAIAVDVARPAQEPDITWSDGRSASGPSVARTLAGSPDGRLLFAVGTGSTDMSSSGVWVFDSQTLKLVERWPALSSYESITTFEHGDWLAAIGRPGVTATGGPADWGTSVTVHDTTTGQPVLRIGDLKTTRQVVFDWPGPLAATP